MLGVDEDEVDAGPLDQRRPEGELETTIVP